VHEIRRKQTKTRRAGKNSGLTMQNVEHLLPTKKEFPAPFFLSTCSLKVFPGLLNASRENDDQYSLSKPLPNRFYRPNSKFVFLVSKMPNNIDIGQKNVKTQSGVDRNRKRRSHQTIRMALHGLLLIVTDKSVRFLMVFTENSTRNSRNLVFPHDVRLSNPPCDISRFARSH
jgi:hypothetical protein